MYSYQEWAFDWPSAWIVICIVILLEFVVISAIVEHYTSKYEYKSTQEPENLTGLDIINKSYFAGPPTEYAVLTRDGSVHYTDREH